MILTDNIYDQELEIDLVQELSKTMKLMGFKKENIEKFENSSEATSCKNLPGTLQRSQLMYYFSNLLIMADQPAPDEVRLVLTIAIRPIDWLADMTTGFLPYIKDNEDIYFK